MSGAAPILKRLLDVDEAAECLNCSVDYVRRLVWRGELSHVRLGRLVRIDIRDLERFIAKNRESVA